MPAKSKAKARVAKKGNIPKASLRMPMESPTGMPKTLPLLTPKNGHLNTLEAPEHDDISPSTPSDAAITHTPPISNKNKLVRKRKKSNTVAKNAERLSAKTKSGAKRAKSTKASSISSTHEAKIPEQTNSPARKRKKSTKAEKSAKRTKSVPKDVNVSQTRPQGHASLDHFFITPVKL